MKYFNYLLFAFLIISCGTEEESLGCQEEKYEEEFSARLGDVVCFPDGNTFEVKTITDQFCCCQCVCVWQGELQVMVETTYQDGTKDLFDFGSESYDSDFAVSIFPGYTVRQFSFLYDGKEDALPLCEGEYDPAKVELILTISTI